MEEQPTVENDATDDVYRQLQQHLDGYPVPFIETKTGSDIAFLKVLFTPEEAKIGSMLKWSWDDYEPLDSICERLASLGHSNEELEQMLDNIARKGAIHLYIDDNGAKSYSGAQLVFGMFENQINKLSPEFVETMKQYLADGEFMAMGAPGVAQMRVVPVGVSFEQKTAIATFDDIKQIMEAAEGPFSVQNCICRQYYDMQDKHCKNTERREVCMGWGRLGKMAILGGVGREVSREEALEILRKNEEEGMILQPANSQTPEFVCSCCTCCDLALRLLKTVPTPATFVQTNYFAQSDPELCTGCGTCVDRCQMEAITLEDEKSVVNKMRCIGCGNCAKTCPSEAMSLQKKSNPTIPPEYTREVYERFLQVRAKEKEREMKKQVRQARRKVKSEVTDADAN